MGDVLVDGVRCVIRGVGASEDGFIRYYAGAALANRVDGLQRNAKALVRRKRIFPFLRVGEMRDVLVDGVRGGFGEDDES